MEREKKDKDFIHPPEYPGGPKAMSKFIYEQLRYPAEALAAGVEGRVIVLCDINDDGEVVNAQVIKGLGYGCDEEALRVVRLLRFQVRRTRGLRVVHHKKIHIQFRRPPQPQTPAPSPISIQYEVVESPSASGAASPEPSKAYEYTIRWTTS